MAQKSIVFIIPGFGHSPQNKAYLEISKQLRKQGHIPVSIKIPWVKSTISQNTSYFIDKYERKLSLKSKNLKRRKVYILGFSFGALIAMIASTKLSVNGLILCSLSPFFKEDLPKTKPPQKSILERTRYQDFSKFHYRKIAKTTKAKKVLMLYGSKESKPLIKRVTKTYANISARNKYLLPIQKTEHNISDKKYLSTINQVLTNFI